MNWVRFGRMYLSTAKSIALAGIVCGQTEMIIKRL